MELFDNMMMGFSVAISWSSLWACFIGVTLGTFIGVLPGVGALAGISLLMPLTFGLPATDAMVMLAGIYYGSIYGGSTAAILLNLPGSVTSAVTCFDGYPMAQKGEAGKALAMTTLASFIGGCFAIVLMMAFAPPLVAVAQSFGSPEYFSMTVLGLLAASTLSQGSPIKGIAMVVVGLLLGLVGTDIQSGAARFTFGSRELLDGISLVVLAMGLFGVSEILINFTSSVFATSRQKVDTSWHAMWPTKTEWKDTSGSMARGSVLGSIIGVLPGAGAAIAAFIAYSVEKRVSKTPERFGKGAIEGLAAAETANNAAAQAAFIPTMSLGIPGSATMALLLGALLIHGIQPGPLVIQTNPDLFWGLIASFWIGNLMLLVLNLPLIGIWVRMLLIPYHILYPCILFFICLGAYSARNNPIDIFLVIVFGLMGYGMKLLQLPAAPLLLGLVLGPMAEEHFRRALLLSRGDPMVFLTEPISAGLLVTAAIIVASTIWSSLRRRKRALADMAA
ncbi:tripartite tricarboxylate transporter permease [Chachezhania antarctica]|uniref:tripartite tricarboxylate transporter permease n=1 Tax=Chachezhania antarctica TaxID=2340860 RepID=UPI000EAE476C|nr:tripartite tricarboxylate transporter permease [Chachezhania antarctica]|tara:strand:- start:9483 stop:10997 length:1515 start_codon:yes stop_codon:yes gene_type:complete